MRTTLTASISLGDTDAAGVLFYPRLFDLVQRAFEGHMASAGMPIAEMFDAGLLTPVVHCEADYRGPLRLGDEVTVESSVESIGDSSFRMAYLLRRGDGTLVAEALVVHVCLGPDGHSRPVPEELRSTLGRSAKV